MVRCRLCNRPIKNPESERLGLGSKCARKLGLQDLKCSPDLVDAWITRKGVFYQQCLSCKRFYLSSMAGKPCPYHQEEVK